MTTSIDRASIERTYGLITPYIRVTPVVETSGADFGLAAFPLAFKPVHAFDQEETLLGQGTLALELTRQAPGLDTLLVAVGGGGRIGGIAAWCGGRPRVIGVEPEAAPTLTRALEAGKPVDAPAGGIAADSLAPRRVGEIGRASCRERV